MSLDKGIKSGKEWRKRSYRSKEFDPSCRNHKGCPACEGNRMYQTNKAKAKAEVKDE